jgi:hypothetical protein
MVILSGCDFISPSTKAACPIQVCFWFWLEWDTTALTQRFFQPLANSPWMHHPPLCHPERSPGTCSAPRLPHKGLRSVSSPTESSSRAERLTDGSRDTERVARSRRTPAVLILSMLLGVFSHRARTGRPARVFSGAENQGPALDHPMRIAVNPIVGFGG